MIITRRIALSVALFLWVCPGQGQAGAQATGLASRDDQVGVCVHFDQGWAVSEIMPMVADLGVGWIRDGISWSEIEPKPHAYTIPPRLSQWLDAAQASHLKVLFVLGYGNKAYQDPFDPDAYARAEVFLATHFKDK